MRKITIYLRDYVDDSRRRERRRGTIIAIVAVLVTLFVAGAFRPAATGVTPVTVTTDTTPTTVITPPTDTTPTTGTTGTPTVVATPAKISVPVDAVDFHALPGNRSVSSLVTVRNVGDEPLSVSNVRIEGIGFEVTANGCTSPLSHDGTCSLELVFAPQTPDRHIATLIIESNGGTVRLRLVGNTTPPVDLGTIDFGRQMIGTHVPPQTVRFSNKTGGPVAVVTSSITPDNSPFAVIGEPCGVVAFRGGCDVTIVFTPRPDQSNAELRLYDANKNLLGVARLTGVGYQRLITVNPALIQTPAKKP